jgi:hypothetical protein
MRKFYILLFWFLILINSTSFAQIIKGYGIKFGTTNAFQNWDYNISLINDFDTDKRWGINAGLFMEFLNTPYFNICLLT